MNQKREQQTILNEILRDKRRTRRKIKLVKRKNLNKKKNLQIQSWSDRLMWEYFVSVVKPKEFCKKNFRLEEALFFDLVSNIRPYISPIPNSPNKRALCADKKVAMTLYYLKDCGT